MISVNSLDSNPQSQSLSQKPVDGSIQLLAEKSAIISAAGSAALAEPFQDQSIEKVGLRLTCLDLASPKEEESESEAGSGKEDPISLELEMCSDGPQPRYQLATPRASRDPDEPEFIEPQKKISNSNSRDFFPEKFGIGAALLLSKITLNQIDAQRKRQ